jgi:hypothetical protein
LTAIIWLKKKRFGAVVVLMLAGQRTPGTQIGS